MENPPSERARNPWGIFKLNGLCTDFDDSKAEGPEEYVTFSTARWKTSTRRIHRCAYVSPPRRTSSIRRYTGKEKYEFAILGDFRRKNDFMKLGQNFEHFCHLLTRTLGQSFMWASCGIVFVTTTASKQAALMREMAGPEKMPWVKMAYVFVAPASINLEK